MNSGTPRTQGIAAFFDLDGTLIPGPTLERRFIANLRRDSAIPLVNYLRWGLEALRLLPGGIMALQNRNKRYLTGLRTDLALQYFESIVFYEEALGRVLWHARQHHEIVLVSGTLEPFARLTAIALECEMEAHGVEIRTLVCATRLEERDGRWTGRLRGEPACGQGKQLAITGLAREYSLDLGQCHAYGNSLVDRHLLAAVGYANAVNPGRELAAIANQKDWPILHWVQQKKALTPVSTDTGAKIQELEGRA